MNTDTIWYRSVAVNGKWLYILTTGTDLFRVFPSKGVSMKIAVLTITEAARLLGISRASAYRAAARAEIPTIRLGKRVVVPLPALEHMLETGIQPNRAGDGETAA